MQYYDKKAVGERIKRARMNVHMTQCSMAEKLDYVSERQLQRIESGTTACSVDKLMEIAQILDISTDYLLFGEQLYDRKCTLWEQIVARKSLKQISYLEKTMQAIADNLSVLDM